MQVCNKRKMPKIVEMTVEIGVQKVSCPGVWLCQDGRVSLIVVALGTDYQTCLLPPVFPLLFKDVFFFRKRFMATCAINNLSCLLNETIYCELVQWPVDSTTHSCKVLAQYLGNLDDVLFPPDTCWSDGVDLLMKRTKDFPGILAPKIEICTKIRIDEVWQSPTEMEEPMPLKTCRCKGVCDGRDAQEGLLEGRRQKQVCHSTKYHRHKGHHNASVPIPPISELTRSFLSPVMSKSVCSLPTYEDRSKTVFHHNKNPPQRHRSSSSGRHRSQGMVNRSSSPCNVFNAKLSSMDQFWNHAIVDDHSSTKCGEDDYMSTNRTSSFHPSYQQATVEGYSRAFKGGSERHSNPTASQWRGRAKEAAEMLTLDDTLNRTLIESMCLKEVEDDSSRMRHNLSKFKLRACDCEICRRYHELFHDDKVDTMS